MTRNEFVIKARKDLQMTQYEFADLIGDSQSNVSAIESGEWILHEKKFKDIIEKLGYSYSITVYTPKQIIQIEP